MTKEDWEAISDMMAMEENMDSNIEFEMDGFAITEDGLVTFTDRETIKYEKALRKQKRDRHFREKRVEHKTNMRTRLTLVKG